MVANLELLTTNAQPQIAPEIPQIEIPEGELHLRFYTGVQELALSAIAIREVISIAPDRITPIPNTSPLILGALNLRGRVIWVADLGQLLGESTVLNTERAEISIIAVEDQEIIVGLAVDKIVGMEWLNIEAVKTLTNTADNVAAFCRGEWLFADNQHLRLLDAKAIVQSARWLG